MNPILGVDRRPAAGRWRQRIATLVVLLLAGCGSRSALHSGGGASDAGAIGGRGGDAQAGPDGAILDGPRLMLDGGGAAVLVAFGVTPALATAGVGSLTTFTAIARYSDGSTVDVTTSANWSSSAMSVAAVYAGQVKTAGAGVTTITATFMGQAASATLTVTSAKLGSVTVNPAAATLAIGGTLALAATAHYADGSKQDVTAQASWSTSDPGVASISAAGLVTGARAGNATASASFDGLTGSSTVAVTAATPTSLQVSPGNPTLPLSGTQQFTATAVYSDGSKGDVTAAVTWQSSDPMVLAFAMVPGLATATAPGTSIVTATLGMLSASSAVTVTAAAVTSLQVTPETASLPKGTTQAFRAQATFSDGSSSDVTASVVWSSADGTVVSISNAPGSEGVASALGVGATVITAALSGVTGAAKVMVTDATVTGLVLAPKSASVAVGAMASFTATASFSDGSQQDVTSEASWTVSDPSLASASNLAGSAGQVTGIKPGTVVVTGAFGGQSDTAKVTVNSAVLTAITVNPGMLALMAGVNQGATATGSYSDGSTADITTQVTWSTDAATIATVSNAAGSAGQVTGVGAGTTTLRAQLAGQQGKAVVSVTAPQVMQLSVSPATATARLGQNQQFGASVVSSIGGTSRNVTLQATWTSSNPMVATVATMGGATGRASCVAAGSATITASYMGLMASATLTCSQPMLASLQVTPFLGAVQAGMAIAFAATAIYSDGSSQNVTGMATWSSSNAMVATVAMRGQVTGVAAGTANISAGYMGLSASAQVTVTTPMLTGLGVTPVATSLRVGQAEQFTATALYSDGSSRDVTAMATWTSSNGGVAAVSAGRAGGGPGGGGGGGRGQVSALAPGTASITATYMGLSSSGTITVSAPKLVSVEVTPVTATLTVAQQQALQATALFDDDTTQNVTGQSTWTSSNAMVAGVTTGGGGRGQVTALTAGTATITATYMGQSGTAAVTVSAATLMEIQVTPTSPTLPNGSTQQFQATAVYSDFSTRNVTADAAWSSSDETVAKISNAAGSRGLATAIGPGTVTITAAVMGKSGTTTLTITSATVKEIQVTPAGASAPAGVTVSFVATAIYSDATSRSVTTAATWTSSDGSIAAVAPTGGTRGQVTALKPGTATISASFGGTSGGTTFTVGAQTLTGITVSPPMSMLAAGSSEQLAASGNYSDGSTYLLTTQATWIVTTGDGTIAAVSNAAGSQGLVTGLGAGSAAVEAHFGGQTGSAAVVVH